jgi:hypothetical protein
MSARVTGCASGTSFEAKACWTLANGGVTVGMM